MKKTEQESKGKWLKRGSIAAALMVMFALTAGFMFQENIKPGQASAQENNGVTQELDQVSAYLSQLDEEVVMNKESLEKIQGHNESYLMQIQDMQSEVTELEEWLKETLAEYHDADETISKGINMILESLTLSGESLKRLEEQMQDSLVNMGGNIQDKQEAIEKSIQAVKAELAEAQKNMTSLLELFREEERQEHEEQNKLVKEAAARLEQLASEDFRQLNQTIRLENEEAQKQADEKVIILSEKLKELHIQIQEAQEDVAQMRVSVEAKAEAGQEEMKVSFNQIQKKLELIQLAYHETQEEIKELLADLKQNADENHSELIKTLEGMETQMEQSSQSGMTMLTESMNQLSQNYEKSIGSLKNEMNSTFLNMDSGISEQFQSLNKTIENRCDGVFEKVGNSEERIVQLLDSAITKLDSRLETVFTYVSSGKQLLASALLTKGIDCNPDATFNEIYQKILDIPQELLIGVEQVPGSISYEYHYHIDGEGNNTHQENNPIQGGCYTIPVYHIHQGSSSTQGGCYTTPVYHSHSSGCYETINSGEYGCHTIRSWDAGGGYKYYEMSCGQTIHGTNSSHGHTVLNCSRGGKLEYYALGCGKNGSTVEGYRPGCGLNDGQITAAHIVYNQEGLKPLEINANAVQETDMKIEQPEQKPEPEAEEADEIPVEIQNEPEMESSEEETEVKTIEPETEIKEKPKEPEEEEQPADKEKEVEKKLPETE